MKYIKNYNESNQIGGVPSLLEWVPPQTIKSRNSFQTGKSEILKNSDEFKNISGEIKKCPAGATITVEGGASAVGSPGFDNYALAQRRAQNMIKALVEINPNLRYQEGTHKVGKSTVKDSEDAKKEQYIMVQFTKPSGEAKSRGAVDNTSVEQPGVKNTEITGLGGFERNLRIIFPGGMSEQECEAQTKKIIDFLPTLADGYKYGKYSLKPYVPVKK